MTPVHVEKLKQEYTDQYVVVDESRPELARFAGAVGQVKTVNRFGRALVQFDIEKNLGWFDIEVDYLKVVDKPPPKEPEAKQKTPPRKPAVQTALPEKEPAALEKARGANGQETAGNAAVAKASAVETPAADGEEEKGEPQ